MTFRAPALAIIDEHNRPTDIIGHASIYVHFNSPGTAETHFNIISVLGREFRLVEVLYPWPTLDSFKPHIPETEIVRVLADTRDANRSRATAADTEYMTRILRESAALEEGFLAKLLDDPTSGTGAAHIFDPEDPEGTLSPVDLLKFRINRLREAADALLAATQVSSGKDPSNGAA